MRRQRAFTVVDLLGTVFVLVLLVVIMLPILGSRGNGHQRSVCQTNLSAIIKGVALYSSMSNDKYPFPLLAAKGDPMAKLDKSTCGNTSWDPALGTNAMQNVWLLVEHNMIGVGSFKCPFDRRWTPWSAGAKGYRFGWCSETEFSYGMHFPYDFDLAGNRSAAQLSDPDGVSGLVIFADRNPGGSVGPNRPPSNHPDDGESFARRDTSCGFYQNLNNSNAGYNGDDIYVNAAGAAGGTPIDVSGSSSGIDTSICPGK
jgi:competence protein ComGC